MNVHSLLTIDLTPLVRRMAIVVVAVIAVVGLACRAPEVPREEGAEPDAAAEGVAAVDMAPALSWMSPQDGATVTSPVHVMFHATNFQISAVPEGPVETTRPGAGHYHVGVDTECLPAGVEIPKADPWVHFGDGGSMMNMQLASGEHTLTLQIGDDLHRTVEDLCSTITVSVIK